ncbi:growth factor receptor-bound 7-like protein [Labeo rohita]|uniref:Growth factor receptor-bound 7-like protein n=1 Tax=Labeo rohita TaxID=84645 RepID=A0A498MYQ8_LABRO|nr:growth factor receptor-bound 7-like protein [Labeo rohita]RXN24654.1 growth factor receptor-bound 7-like protein [Labeo rohita]
MEVKGCRSEVEVFRRPTIEAVSRRDSVSVKCSPASQSLQMSTPRAIPLTIRNTHSITTKREFRASSAPLIPNPFPELCSPTHSPVLTGSLNGRDPPSNSSTHVLRVFGDATHSRSVLVTSGTTAHDVCHMLAQSAHCTDEESWALIEHHSALGLERCLEDHELVVQLFFPEHMISDSADDTKGMTSSELVQNTVKSGSCPEIQGFLHVREGGKKSWKKLYFLLRRSGLYCSSKGQSKEPRHLQFVGDLEDLNVFTVFNGRKLYGAPGEHVFSIKKREALRHSLPTNGHGSQLSAVHRVQPWFHGGVSRNEAQRLLEEQGQVDGMFMIRDSRLHTQCFVLSLCYKLKTKHYLIIPLEEGDKQYYTMDDGVTLFTDLLQLVEFHQINRGILPVCLKHPCTCIAL